jgi:hypothetical protein
MTNAGLLTIEALNALLPDHHYQPGVSKKKCSDGDRSYLTHTDGFPQCPRCAYLGYLEGVPFPDGLVPSLYFQRSK